jgi:hypothetical protein
MHFSTSNFEDTSVFIDHRYVIQVLILWVGKKNECELIPNVVLLIVTAGGMAGGRTRVKQFLPDAKI